MPCELSNLAFSFPEPDHSLRGVLCMKSPPPDGICWRLIVASICCQLLMMADSQAVVAKDRTLTADVLIVGGTESGCAAAVQAARMGVRRIVLVNDIEWLGGQFSAEALLAIDENRGPAGYDHTVPFPRNGMFREVIDRIEQINKQKYGRARPGNTRVITTCRPSDAAQAFRELVRPYVDSGQLTIVSNHYPIAATRDGDRLTAITFAATDDVDSRLTVEAKLTIDASDWGDAIKLAGAAYEFGPDLKSKYGEPLAPESREGYPLTDMNPITYCMVLNETDRYEPIAQPVGYDVRNYRTHTYPKDPLWLYESRRVIDHYNFEDVTQPDVLLLCFPAFDYPLDVHPQKLADALEATEAGASRKNIVELTRQQRQLVFEDAKQYSLGFLYYLQTEVHDAMPDKTHSFRRFELTDEFGTPDRMPFKPYVRESLRLKAQYMLRQQDTTGVGGNARHFANVMYHDAVACWQFEYDFHPTRREFLDDGNPAGPWRAAFRKGRTWGPPYSGLSQFPLRSLVPEKIDGLLGCQKNLGYSSIVSSAVRLHDQSMAIGAAAGAVAAVAVTRDCRPREIPYDRGLLGEVWSGLCSRIDGAVPNTLWPFRDLEPGHPAFEAANLLAVRGSLPVHPRKAEFKPDEAATLEWKVEAVRLTLATKQPPAGFEILELDGAETRGEFARRLWAAVRSLPDQPFEQASADDADADGIPDGDDALPFNAAESSWEETALPADADGHPDPLPEGTTTDVRLFNFTGQGSKPVDGFVNDYGRAFDGKRGFGWQRDISASNRRRGQIDGEQRDTFLFTRSHDVWELAVVNGRYEVTVCVGDSGHDQTGQNVTVEGHETLRDIDTLTGEWIEKTVTVDVADGRLTIEIGLPGRSTNTCLNWLRVVRR
ncbi:FAD-dependent oxidoreductase [bacterium]|nr:FAD-dependent oxidoreductase [bacterium]